ncbi:glycine betaine/L-proline ABC transporter substrate-binding protein ProX [Amphritea sp. 2_MG-2023]|uniref:glycine betaine/L-proline ABC transporter substrate-binding protein ProX n=1 Tax=Amphritea TaxID=515417 RepID=UPI001C066C2F|nr:MULTISPECIES: glycine betaine/L-proline ABC transporter substrate-binding protein ProX [Amphritea]MBU2965275.1 glycine betaine/L-proline ABC transporter substrate-binding protein ProX [Amphritea atlantica]MDO6420137.1 glycine betaine/L-proline ABC transporter substrate-binding protein ProX [Amphritea sp. 2_MG-2023]MDX2421053.1 glycine betaine/L-proline ABC transporter substrate-binding protein ProX [Amphritea sp.]
MIQSHLKKLNRSMVKLTATAALAALTFSATSQAESMPGKGVEVTPIFPSIAEERFRGEIAIAGLEALGYEVEEPKETEYATMMLALSYGDADFSVHMWDILHDSFYQKAGGDKYMVKAGDIIPGVLQGYLIDKKTADKYNITKLTDLQKPEIAKLFDANGDGKADLTGCNPGWGCELVINHHMKAYDLEDTVSHNQGSYFALMADTITRYKEGQPVFYFTWVPQWIAGVLVEGEDVVWLEVPYTSLPDGNNDVNTSFEGKNLGFAVDQVKSVLNREFAEENPVATKFLSLVQITAGDESAQNLKMQNGEKSIADIKRHAHDWIAAHQAKFDSWLAAARAVEK